MNGQLGVRILLSYLRRIGSEQTWLNLEIEPETIWKLGEVQPIYQPQQQRFIAI